MTDIPIIFSAPMILALLANRKTMTRRLLYSERHAKGGVVPATAMMLDGHPLPCLDMRRHSVGTYWTLSGWHKAKPGDRLWVRETWQSQTEYDKATGRGATVRFAASWHPGPGFKWRSPIHMPRWASRLTLVVTAAKIERLQEIGEADAQAEGVQHRWLKSAACAPRSLYFVEAGEREHSGTSARAAFEMLWCSLHGPDAWAANPEIVALTFAAHNGNIDAMKTPAKAG
jgi:hypothetical protein